MIGALPAERRQPGVAEGIEHGIEVTTEADARDDELAGLAGCHPLAEAVHDGDLPARERTTDGDRLARADARGGADDGRLGRPVGVPDLPAPSQPPAELGRAGFATEDEQAHVGENLVVPHRRERRDGRDDGDAVLDQPRTEVDPRLHEGARAGHEGGPVAPRQPHLFAARVEPDRQPGEHAVVGSDVPQRRLGVHERGGGPMPDDDALRRTGRTRGEDHPAVVIRLGGAAWTVAAMPLGDRELRRDHGAGIGFTPDQLRPRLRVREVHRHVRSPGEQGAEDGDVEIGRAARHPDADAVPAPDARRAEPASELSGLSGELVEREASHPVIEGHAIWPPCDRGVDDVDQRARGRRISAREDRRQTSGRGQRVRVLAKERQRR